MALPAPELRLYGKNLNKVRPGHSRNYWTDIEQWKAGRESVTGKVPTVVNVTTRSPEWSRELSPMLLGPIDTYQEDGKMLLAVNAEVAWQYSKIYSHQVVDGKLQPLNFLTSDGKPNPRWFAWRDKAWTNPIFHHAHKKFDDNKDLVRRAFRKGSKVAGWYWDGRTIDPVTARREIYATVYCKAVRTTDAFKKLSELFAQGDVAIYDIDGYDYLALGMSPEETILDLSHSWGHGLLLALMLTGIDPTQLGKTAPPTSIVKPNAPVTIKPPDLISFGKSADSYGWLGNMAGDFPIEHEGITYGSSESLFQCLRFPNSPKAQEAIRSTKSPLWAKKRASKYKGELKVSLRDAEDLKRMRFCLVLKLKHNPQIIPALLDTASREIVEDCTARPHDQEIDGSKVSVPFWGAIVGRDQIVGENALGKLWMEIREQLRTTGKAVAVSPKGDIVEVPRNSPAGKSAFAKHLKIEDRPLTAPEKKKLKSFESKIESGKKKVADGFAEMVGAMFGIYEQRLYREGGRTFAEYFRKQWNFERAHSYRLIHCGRLLQAMAPDLQTAFTKQAHFRPLLALRDDARIESALKRVTEWKEKLPSLEVSPAVVESAAVFEVILPALPLPVVSAKISASTVDGYVRAAEEELIQTPSRAPQILGNLRKQIARLGKKSSTGINWTQATWNPLQGCKKISAGCQYCYAATLLATRLKSRYPGIAHKAKHPKKGASPYDFTGKVLLLVDALSEPIDCKTPKSYFVNSLSDLFYEKVPDWFVEQVFDVMEKASWHVFQVLTKRPDRMADFTARRYAARTPPANVWLGTTVEDQKQHDSRIPQLKKVVAAVKWLSCEPLLAPLKLDVTDLHWVVVGGESGSGRKMEKAWATAIRDQCQKASIPFFFKQWGDFGEDGNPNKHRKAEGDEKLDGATEHAYPVINSTP